MTSLVIEVTVNTVTMIRRSKETTTVHCGPAVQVLHQHHVLLRRTREAVAQSST